ncbi:MAG: hypothetical protein NWE83_06625 [Candidatus Bathyarchaeota archaeon]|nr:hypothetical protein [Candidatus Bathyarchaeota archaeon]
MSLTTSMKGTIVESYLAQFCIAKSEGQLNVAQPLADDEGVDLIFYKRGQSDKTLYAQVKSRYATSKRVRQQQIQCRVKRSSFNARENYYMLFLAFDHEEQQIEKLWLVPSIDFEEKTRNQTGDKLVFSTGYNTENKWTQYRIDDLDQLPKELLEWLH